MSDEQRFRDALTATDAPRREFEVELRRRLTDEWHGRHSVTPTRPDHTGRPWWAIGAAAAAVTALVVTGLVFLSSREDRSRVVPPADSAPIGTSAAPSAATTIVTSDLAIEPAPSRPVHADGSAGGVDGPVMYARQVGPDDAVMAALIAGVLDREGDCLFVQGDTSRHTVLWPSGTTWDAAAGAVVTPNGTVIRLLDDFEAGGGYVQALEPFTTAPAVLDRAASCATIAGSDEIAIVQSDPRVTATVPENGPCYAGLPAEQAIQQFVDTMIAARTLRSASLTRECLPTTPDLFTGSPPACWELCAHMLFAGDGVRAGEVVEPDGSTYWTVAVPVSYYTEAGYRDVVENWAFQPLDGGWRVSLTSIDPPLPDRAESLATINRYITAIAERDWVTAAELLMRGDAPPEERADIRQLAPESYDQAAIAAALEAWCAAGCDTTPVDDDGLRFTGGYEWPSAFQPIRATWFEGSYGVHGAPPLVHGPSGAQTLAGWPSPPRADPEALDTLPYFLPGLSSSDMPGITATRSDGVVDEVVHPRYHQVWFDVEQATVLHVTTMPNLPPTTAAEFRRPAEVAGWDTAFVVDGPGEEPVVNLYLGTPEANVLVQGIGLTEDAVVETARSLRPRPAGTAGWGLTILRASTIAFGEGWDTDHAGHTVRWHRDDGVLVGELHVGYGSIAQALTDQHWADTRQFREIDGAFAVVTDTSGTVAVTWRPAPGVTALLGWHGPMDEALAVVDSLYRVGRAEWQARVPPATSTGDGCQSLFC